MGAVGTGRVWPALLTALALVGSGCAELPKSVADGLHTPSPTASASVTPRASSAAPQPTSRQDAANQIAVQAHMGGGALGAPNSAKLFRKTSTMGFAMVEFDIQITRDGVAVINHSDTVMDMPGRSCTHDGLRIHTQRYSEVKRIRCAGEPLPTFAEVLSIYKNTNVKLNVEIKAWDNHATQRPASLRSYARSILKQLDQAGFEGRYIISCFDWRILLPTLRKTHPDLYVIALERSSRMMQPTTSMYSSVRKAAAMGANAFEMDLPFAQEGLLRFVTSQGMDPQVWYANTPAEVRFAIANGINPVSSDDPVMARKVISGLSGKLLRGEEISHRVPERTVLRRGLQAGSTTSAKIIGGWGLIPSSAQSGLSSALLEVRLKGMGGGTLTIGPAGGTSGTTTTLSIPRGTKRFTVQTSPGDQGRVELSATADVDVAVVLTGYEKARYRAVG